MIISGMSDLTASSEYFSLLHDKDEKKMIKKKQKVLKEGAKKFTCSTASNQCSGERRERGKEKADFARCGSRGAVCLWKCVMKAATGEREKEDEEDAEDGECEVCMR